MSYMCIRSNKECDSCGACREEEYELLCDVCEEPIEYESVYFKIGTENWCYDCLFKHYGMVNC